MENLTITLAGKEYTIQPLTVGQLQDLHIGVVRVPSTDSSEAVKDFWKTEIDTIVAALSQDHPDMTAEVVRKMRLGSLKEVKKQVDAILLYAGLIDTPRDAPKAGAAQPGEAAAGKA